MFEHVQRSADTFLHICNYCEPHIYKTALGERLQYCLTSVTQTMPALCVFGCGFTRLFVKFGQLLYLKEFDAQVGLASFFS